MNLHGLVLHAGSHFPLG
jgi:hypothetical protein